MVKDGSAVVGMSVWDVLKVPSDPCLWNASMTTPGPTVDDLVEALLSQTERNATEPADVTLAGYSGKYLEWSVPDDLVVTGDANFDGCDQWPDGEARDYVSWVGTGGSDRYQQVAGQLDRLWILDVAGDRLVVDATYSPDATEIGISELEDVVESLAFEHP